MYESQLIPKGIKKTILHPQKYISVWQTFYKKLHLTKLQQKTTPANTNCHFSSKMPLFPANIHSKHTKNSTKHQKRQHKVKNSATQSPRFHKFKTHQAHNNSSHKSKPKTINTQLQTEEKYHLLHHTPLFRHHSKLHSYNNQHSLITTIIASMIKSGCDQPEFLTFSIIVFNKNSFETTKPHY